MSPSSEHTRREFLLRLAKAAVFVPPALATLDVDRAAALVRQGGGTGGGGTGGGGTGGGGKGGATGAGSTIGSLSSSGQTVQGTSFQTRGQTSDRTAPWTPGTSSPAPWQRPPPTSKGGE